MNDEVWMTRALELAERGRGFVEPNPLVGAVIVREDQMVGEGWHERFGQNHAEVNALKQAGEAARGATLYVTLEPCCHHGKTPPCTNAVIQAGIGQVVAAMLDPFPQVASQGIARLQTAGIEVTVGICEQESRRLNAPYLKLVTRKQPYVHAKWAMTLDGKMATRTGDSKWISNDASRRRVHELRGRMDAIIAGIGTVLADDPLLTARPPGPRTATRIVLDSQGRLPVQSQLVQTASAVPVLVITSSSLPEERAEPLRNAGCEILNLHMEGRPGLQAFLGELGQRRMTNVMIEGGAEVFGRFADGDCIDEYHVFIAPRIAGGKDARSPIGGLGVEKIADALTLSEWEIEMIEGNIYVRGRRNG